MEVSKIIKREKKVTNVGSNLSAPEGEAWDSWYDDQCVTDDFMDERDQPQEQSRDPL